MYLDKLDEKQKTQKVEIFDDLIKNKIHTTMLLDELVNPKLLMQIGYDGLPTKEPLKDDKLIPQMYWRNETKTVGMLIAIPSFIYMVLLLGLNGSIFDGFFHLIVYFIKGVLSIVPGL